MHRVELTCEDFQVQKVRLEWGLEQRPLWTAMESLPLDAAIKWADRFGPMESFAAEWAVAAALEQALKIRVTERVENLRSIYLELQRVLWSFNYLANLFCAIGDKRRTEEALKLREMTLDIQENLTGNRILPQILRVGGLERDLSLGERKKLKATIGNLSGSFRQFFGHVEEDSLLNSRLSGVLPISYQEAYKLSLRGPLGQASGVSLDARIQNPLGLFGDYGIHCFAGPFNGDVWARFRSVLFQVAQSLKLLSLFLSTIPEGGYRLENSGDGEVPNGFWIQVVESGSGPLFAMVRGKRIRIASHTTRLKGVIEELLVGLDRDDFELGFASLGFDFAQADAE